MINLYALKDWSVALLQPTHHLLPVPDLPVKPLHTVVIRLSLELDRADVLHLVAFSRVQNSLV